MRAELPLDENQRRRLVLKLLTQLRCAKCSQPYKVEDFALVHRWPHLWVLSTRCRHCDESAHVAVFMHPIGEADPAVDLTPEEAPLAAEWSTITADDVLDTHVFLQEFDGDFETLFAG